MTTNLPFEAWPEVCGSEWLTGAVLDRLTHRVHILEANGESYRLRGLQATAEGPEGLAQVTQFHRLNAPGGGAKVVLGKKS